MNAKTFIDQFDQLVTRIYRFEDAHESMSNIRDEIYEFLDQHYGIYLSSNSKEREEIRELVKKHHSSSETPKMLDLFLIGYVQHSAKQINLTGDEKWLLRGLVVASMENNLLDQRDITFSLSYLYVMAEGRNLDPNTAFQAIAEISSDNVSSGGIIPMSELMRNTPNIARKTYDDWKNLS